MRRLRTMLSGFTLLATAVLLPTPALWSQITQSITDGSTPPAIAPGAPAGSYALTYFDSVNLYSGNLNFRLPLLQAGGRGDARTTLTLPIESHWTIDRTTYADGTASYYPVATWWPGAAVGYGPGFLVGRNAREQDFCSDGSILVTYTLLRLTFITPDGTEYELRDKLTDGQTWFTGATCSSVPGSGRNRGREFVSRDGTALTFLSDTDLIDDLLGSDIWPSGSLLFRDGTRYRVNGGKVDWIRDRNGNLLTFQYDSYRRVTRITDSILRRVDISYPPAGAAPPLTDTITFKGFGGAQRQIRVFAVIDVTGPRTPLVLALTAAVAAALGRECNADVTDDTPFFTDVLDQPADSFVNAIKLKGTFDDYRVAAQEFYNGLARVRRDKSGELRR